MTFNVIFRSYSIIMILLLVIPLNGSIQAQDDIPVGKLIYGRESSTGEQVVVLTKSERKVFNLPEGGVFTCYQLSENGKYIATSPFQAHPDKLTVFQFDTDEKIFEIPWSDSWHSTCTFEWEDNTTLEIYTGNGEYFTVDISSGKRSEPYTKDSKSCHHLFGIVGRAAGEPVWGMTCEELQDKLPNFVQPNRAFITHAPGNFNVVLYERCSSGETAWNDILGGEHCTGEREAVLYDLDSYETLEVLADPPIFLRTTEDSWHEAIPIGSTYIGWSPSGRYLAYYASPISQSSPQIYVYDLLLREYWEPIALDISKKGSVCHFFMGVNCTEPAGIVWSLDEQKFAFWSIAPARGAEPFDDYDIRQLLIFNRESGAVHFVEPVLEPLDSDVTWSPDSRFLAFTAYTDPDPDPNFDREGENDERGLALMVVDAETGDLMILDEGAISVQAWLPDETVQP